MGIKYCDCTATELLTLKWLVKTNQPLCFVNFTSIKKKKNCNFHFANRKGAGFDEFCWTEEAVMAEKLRATSCQQPVKN